MTDTEINIAIAEETGLAGTWADGQLRYNASKECPFPRPFDPCHDLNAMHGVEKCVDADLAHGWRYWTTLAEILCADEQTETWQHYRVLIHATARQRAEAFIKVMGLRKEGA